MADRCCENTLEFKTCPRLFCVPDSIYTRILVTSPRTGVLESHDLGNRDPPFLGPRLGKACGSSGLSRRWRKTPTAMALRVARRTVTL